MGPVSQRLLLIVVLLTVGGVGRAETADVLIAGATDAELAPLLAHMADARTETRVSWTFWSGTLAGKKAVLIRTEGDPLNAVAATTLGIRRYQPKLVITFGSARAHDASLEPGDLVVSEKFAAFDGIFSPQKKIGEGSDATKWRPLPHPMMTAGEQETDRMAFPADAGALAKARALTPVRGRLMVGVLGSANQVNRESDRIAWLRETWGTSCEDGESAHVAGCAFLFGVPVVGLRVIDGREGEAAELVLKFVEARK